MQGWRKLIFALIFLALLPMQVFAGGVTAVYPDNFTGSPNLPIPYTIPTTKNNVTYDAGLNINSGIMTTSASGTTATVTANQSCTININSQLTRSTGTGAKALEIASSDVTVNMNSGSITSSNTPAGGGLVPFSTLQVNANANNFRLNMNGAILQCTGTGAALISGANSNTVISMNSSGIGGNIGFLGNGGSVTMSGSSFITGSATMASNQAFYHNSSGNIGLTFSSSSGCRYERNNSGRVLGSFFMSTGCTFVQNTGDGNNPASGTLTFGSGSSIYWYNGGFSNAITSTGGNSTFYPQANFTQNGAYTNINVDVPSGIYYVQLNTLSGMQNWSLGTNARWQVAFSRTLAPSSNGTLNSGAILLLSNGGTFTQPSTFNNSGTTVLSDTGNISGAFSVGSGILYIGPYTSNIPPVGSVGPSNYSSSGNIYGSGRVVVTSPSGGTSATLNNDMNVSGGVTIDANNTLTMSGSSTISGSGGLSLSGTLNENSSNAAGALGFSGLLDITSTGLLSVNANATRSAGDIQSSGTHNIGNNFTFTVTNHTYTLNNSARITDRNSGPSNLTFSGTGGLVYNATRTDSLQFTGTLTNSATMKIQQNATFPMAVANSGNIQISSGKLLRTNGYVTFSGNAITDAPSQTNGQYTIGTSGTFEYTYSGSVNGLTFSGLFTNLGLIKVTKSLARANTSTSSGNIQIANGQYFQNTGTWTQTGGVVSPSGTTGYLVNTGNYSMLGGDITALFQNLTPGVFTNSVATYTPAANSQNTGQMYNVGIMSFSNAFQNSGYIENQSTAAPPSVTSMSITAPMTSSGTIQNNANKQMAIGGGTASNSNTINNFGTLLINGTTTNNGSIVNKSGATMTVSGSVNNGSGVTGSITNQGTATFTATTTNTNTISNSNSVTINSGVTLTVNSPGSFTQTAGTLQINGTLNGSGAQSFDGIVNLGAIGSPGGALTGTGAFTLASTGVVNLAGTFTNAYSSVSNSGKFYVVSGGSTVNGLTGLAGSSFTVGKNSSGTVSNVNYTTSGIFDGIRTYDIVGGSSFTGAFAIQNMGSNFLVENNATATINGGLSGSGTVTNQGTFNLNSTLSTGTVTSSNAFVMQGSGNIANGTTVNTSGTFTFSLAGSTNNGTITNTGTITGSAGFTNSSTGVINNNNIFNINAAFTNSGLIANTSSMTVASGANISGTGTITNSKTGTLSLTNITNTNTIINNGGTITVTTALGGNGNIQNSSASGQTGALNLVNVTLGNSISNSAVITVTGTLSGTGVVTNNSSGVILVNSATLNQTNPLVNNGNIYINGSSVLSGPTNNNAGTITLNPSSSLLITGAGTIPGGTVYGSGTGTTLTINNDLFTSAAINNVKNIIINTGHSLHLQQGGTVNNFNDFAVNGDLFIENGGIFSIGSDGYIHGNGSLDNNGTLYINGSNLQLGGSFYNHTSGVFEIFGVPSLTFGGSFTNDGEMIATFNASNSLPRINISGTPTLANGTIAIGYEGNYIAGGFYPFIIAGTPLSLTSIGGYQLPEPNFYITNWSLQAQGNSIGVEVTRLGFGDVATTPEARRVGAYLDTLGENNPSQAVLNLLNGLSQITNATELDAALLEVLPPDNVPMQTLNMLEFIGAVQDHIFSLPFHNVGFFIPKTQLYSSGDATLSNGLWVRPYGSSARQRDKGSLIGYTARTNGVIGGFDNQLADNLLLGVAGSYTKSTVTQATNLSSITRIKNYQIMLYSSYKSQSDAFLDSVFSVGTNNYQGTRAMSITTFNAIADSRYSGQQFSAKVMGSKNYRLMRYYQITPMATAQYSFVRQLPYQETNAGPFNRIVQPNNMNLLQLGVGGQFSVPFDEGKITGIPAVYGMLLVDAQGGALVTNTQFISGGPILVNTVQAGRLAARLGMSMSFQVSDSFQVIGNYNIEMRSKYFCNEVFLNLRYVF